MFCCPYCKQLGNDNITPCVAFFANEFPQRVMDMFSQHPIQIAEFYQEVRSQLSESTKVSWLDRPMPPLLSGYFEEFYCPKCLTFGPWMADHEEAKKQFIITCNNRIAQDKLYEVK